MQENDGQGDLGSPGIPEADLDQLGNFQLPLFRFALVLNSGKQNSMSNPDDFQNPYSTPEFSQAHPAEAVAGGVHPSDRVNGPAIGIIVTSIIGIIVAAISLILNLLGAGIGAAGMMGALGGGVDLEDAGVTFGQMVFSVLQAIAGLVVGLVCLFGANKMRNLESYNLAMAASILIMVPCISPCCVMGLPFGIWSLVVLNDSTVKAAFRS